MVKAICERSDYLPYRASDSTTWIAVLPGVMNHNRFPRIAIWQYLSLHGLHQSLVTWCVRCQLLMDLKIIFLSGMHKQHTGKPLAELVRTISKAHVCHRNHFLLCVQCCNKAMLRKESIQ